MPVDVQLTVSEPRLPDPAKIEQWARAVIDVTGESGGADRVDVCIRVVDEVEAQELNSTFRGKDKATNVLSFPAQIELPDSDTKILGDIVICAEVVGQEAGQQGKTLSDHLAHMVVHGMLHLYGFDHEIAVQARVMEQTEREILGRFGIADPYQAG